MELRELLVGAVVGGLLVWLALRAAYAARLGAVRVQCNQVHQVGAILPLQHDAALHHSRFRNDAEEPGL